MRTILLRDVGALLRRPLVLLFLSLMLITLTALTAATWPVDISLTPDEISERGIFIWQSATFAELAFLVILAPALAAPAINSERRSGALTLVMLTGLSPVKLVTAKLLARFLSVSLIVLLPLPILFAVASLGGTDLVSAMQVMIVLFSVALLATSLGLLFSALFDEAHQAVLASYAVLLVPFSLPLILPALGWTQSALVTSRFGLWEANTSPYRNLEYIFSPTRFQGSESYARHFWTQPALFASAAALIALLTMPFVTLSALGRWGIAKKRGQGGFLAPFWDALMGLNPWRRSGLWINPIYWKETTSSGVETTRASHRFGFYLCFMVLILIAVQCSAEGQRVVQGVIGFFPGSLAIGLKTHAIIVGLLMTLVCIAATISGAVSIGHERQTGLLTMMAVTPLSFQSFLWGKSFGIAQNLALLIAQPVLYLLLAVLLGWVPLFALPYVAFSVPVIALFAIVQGIFCSLATNNTTRALVLALSALAIEALGPFCKLSSFNPGLYGYMSVAMTDKTFEDTERLFFSVGSLISFAAHLGLLFLLSRGLRGRFDRFLGRIGSLEFSFDENRIDTRRA